MLLLRIKSALIYIKNLIASLFLDSDPVYNKKNLNAKIKPHSDEVTDIYDKKIPIVDSSHTFLVIQ